LSPYLPRQFQHNYPDGIDRHYWNLARNRVIERALSGIPGQGVILDVGCGRGIVVDHLRRRGLDCWGCEAGAATPLNPEVAPYLFLGREAFALEPGFREKVDRLLLLDLLEHLADPAPFLRLCREAFPGARHALIAVPAAQELWTNYDDYFGHYRRYDRAAVRALLRDAAMQEVWSRHFFHALYPPLRFVAALRLKRTTEVSAPRSWLQRSLHRLAGAALAIEEKVVPGGVAGSSILTLASFSDWPDVAAAPGRTPARWP